MLRLCWTIPLSLALSLVVGGCAGSRSHTECRPADSDVLTVEDTAIQVERGTITPGVEAVRSPEEVEKVLAREEAEPSQHYALTAHQCQCLAVANAAMANAIDTESQLSDRASGHCRKSKARAAALQSDLLASQAIEDRNSAAADALELFYRLAEAEASHDLLESSRAEIECAIEDCRGLEAKGFEVEADGGALRRKKTEILDRQAQLQLSISQLNGALRQRLGSPADDRTPIWPLADLAVTTVAPVDREGVVAEGLACRADLGALRRMLDSVDTISISALRRVMGTINPALGTSPSRPAILCCLFGSGPQRHERETRREQIAEILASREGAAVAEIRAAAEEVETRLRRIALAQQQRDNWQKRLDDLKARRGADGVTAFDVRAAQLEVYQAEADLVGQVAAWRIAEVKVREAQGVLPLECGLSLPQGTCRPPRRPAD